MTLIERWAGFDNEKILCEVQQLLMNFADWQKLFCFDGDGKRIRYCVDSTDDESVAMYRKKAGVCFSEDVAIETIKIVLMNYMFLVIPWLFNESKDVDLCIKTPFPIAYERDENGNETFFDGAIIKFVKGDNPAGFYISKVIPVR